MVFARLAIYEQIAWAIQATIFSLKPDKDFFGCV